MKVIITLAKRIGRHHLSDVAAQMAYFLLLALFPMLIVLVMILSYIHIDTAGIGEFLKRLIPEQSVRLIIGTLNEVIKDKSVAILSVGMLAAFWGSLKGSNALIKGINIVYHSLGTRHIIVNYLIAIVTTISIPLIIVITLVFLITGQFIQNFLLKIFPSIEIFRGVISWIRLVFPLLVTALFFFGFYKIAPAIKVRFRDVLMGTIFTTISWYLASALFSMYIASIGNYSKFYGSLGSVVILMLWLYFSSMIILIGAEINAMFHEKHQSKKLDS